MGVKMAVTKIKSADSKLKGIREKEIFATLSDVPASQNLPVKFSFRYLKWYFNDLNVPKDVPKDNRFSGDGIIN